MRHTAIAHSLTILAIILIFGVHQRTEARDKTDKSPITINFLVAGLSCDGCANSATKELLKIPGVHDAQVDFGTRQASITAESSVTKRNIREALENIGFEAQFTDDPPRAMPLTDVEKAQLDIKIVSHGEAFQVKDHLSKGKFTIFDFYAEWCGPCHLLTPRLERLVQRNNKVALRTVDIVSWKSEAAIQATKEFKMPGLPYVRLYGPDGNLIGAVSGNHFEKIKELIFSTNSDTERK